MRTSHLFAVLSLSVACGGSSERPDAGDPSDAAIDAPSPTPANFSFFITSAGHPNGGDFRRSAADTDGLAGADEFCQMLATAAAPTSASRQWRAYLSTSTVDARDRIGSGPWFNRNGVMIAASVAALHTPAMNMINKANGLDERGTPVPGRGDSPNQHDIITGSTAAGISSGNTCNNWTSSAASGVTATVGHFDRMGISSNIDPMSFVEAHASQGCAAASFPPSGGRGSIYCFAAD